MNEYKHFEVTRFNDCLVMAIQSNRNTIFPGQSLETSNWVIGIGKDGIVINGDFGTNPSAEVIDETTDLICELAESWKKIMSGELVLK